MRVLVPVAAAHSSAWRRWAKRSGGSAATLLLWTRASDGCSLLLVDASALLTLPEHICDEQFH